MATAVKKGSAAAQHRQQAQTMNAKALAPLVAVYLAVCRAAEFTARAPSSGKGIEGAREGTLHNGVGEQGTLPQGAQEQSGEGV